MHDRLRASLPPPRPLVEEDGAEGTEPLPRWRREPPAQPRSRMEGGRGFLFPFAILLAALLAAGFRF